ncbi:hypothetical protein ACF1D2_14085 [Streptomyces bacillaris]|uniref:hypothetical protein n=1 Tax=Streptomyces bacillaris TaxID=68179 RepID=UPI00334B4134
MTTTVLPSAPVVLERRFMIRSVRPPQDAQSARIQAWTCLAVFGWPGPTGSAVAIIDQLVRNAPEFGQCAGEGIEVRIARTDADDLLIDVGDRYPAFPSFERAVAGELGQGLWRVSQRGATVSWHPHEHGKTVRAVVGRRL